MLNNTQIPVDCLHSFFALDYFHGLRFERGQALYEATKAQQSQHHPSLFAPLNGSESKLKHHSNNTLSKSTSVRKNVPLPAYPARTFHPLLTHHFPPFARLLLLTLYDLALSTFLTVHITVFFNLLGVNWDACDDYAPLLPAEFLDQRQTNMTVVERCHSINIDMHVSGGFDIALCCLLLAIHLWHLAFRAWEVIVFGVGKEAEMGVTKQSSALDGSADTGGWADMRDVEGRGKSTAGRFRESSVRERVKGVRDSARDWFEIDEEDTAEVPEKVRWNEVLLECLVH